MIQDMLTAATADMLADSPLFRGVGQAARLDVARKARRLQYEPGDVIVWQGEPSTTVYLVTSGIAAVTRMVAGEPQPIALSYVMPGESFGEVGILERRPRSATVSALTPLSVLALARDDFLDLLHRYPSVAIALARMLGHQLVEADRRQIQGPHAPRLILVLDLGAGGTTVFGQILAARLTRSLAQPTIYAEYPEFERLAAALGVDYGTYQHPEGYDIAIPREERSLPAVVRATLLLDQVLGEHRNAIVVLPGAIDAATAVLLEQATHVVLAVPTTTAGLQGLRQVRADLGRYTASGRAGLSVIAIRRETEPVAPEVLAAADYEMPPLDRSLSPLPPAAPAPLPDSIAQVLDALIARIDRTHQIAVYIPTTIAVDRAFDTAPYVERTLAFLGERFGGATSAQARGVWQSDTAGLVAERVFIVQTYAAEADFHAQLDAVIAYVKAIKHELQQEVMAIEVDHKLVLL